jgi:hypothetical protein
MAIFRAEMAWGISIDILSIDISFVLNKGLNYTEVASQTSDMERCSEVVGPRIYLRIELYKDLNHWRMSFTRCQVERSKAIRVSAVDNFKHLVFLIELLLGIAENFIHFICVSLIDLGPVVHFYLFDVLFSLLLLRRLFG